VEVHDADYGEQHHAGDDRMACMSFDHVDEWVNPIWLPLCVWSVGLFPGRRECSIHPTFVGLSFALKVQLGLEVFVEIPCLQFCDVPSGSVEHQYIALYPDENSACLEVAVISCGPIVQALVLNEFSFSSLDWF